MPNLSNITVFLTNYQIKPTFLEDAAVLLTKDYTTFDPVCNRYLEKDVPGTVIACGLSIYAFSKDTQSF